MGLFLAALILFPGETPAAVANRLAAEYQKATLGKDFAHFEKGSTKDFVYIDSRGGKTARAGALAGMKAMYQSAKFKKFEAKASSAKWVPGGLLYIQDSEMIVTMPMGGPKPSLMETKSKDEVFAVKQGGKWLTKRVRNLKNDVKVDGKPMKGM